ncbi:MAG: HAMP domain-containing sensor histidine kinase [Actinomycetota bacterium]
MGRRGSVRVRATAAAMLVVGLALLVAAVAMVRLMDRSLTANVRTLAEDRADAIVSELRAGRGPDLNAGQADDEFVQIVDASGTVVDSSENVRGRDAVSPGAAVAMGLRTAPSSQFLVVASVPSLPGGKRTVVVGRNLDDVREAIDTASRLLSIGVPILLLVVGAVMWWITARALRPVESMRAEVETISAGDLAHRIEEPATRDEIARLAATLNTMLARLEEAQLRQRRFVSDAAHELRSPVAAIRQHAEVSIAHPGSAPAHVLAGVVLEEALRLQRLADDLLFLARLDEGAKGTAEPVDLDDLVLAEAARLRSASSLRIDTTGVAAARVAGRASELTRVVRNLADNAGRHARATIAFSLSDEGRHVVLIVDDDGPGVAPDARDRVFERFVRLDEARAQDDGGSGLGLAIVRDVTIAHGGTVELTEAPSGGARVHIVLPAGSSD